jgi:hypothetical protein
MLTVGAPDMTRFMFLAYCILQLAQADSDPEGYHQAIKSNRISSMSTLPPAEPLQTPQLTQPAAVSTRGEKLAGIALVSALLYFILALIIFSFLLDYLIAWMYVGKSYPVLNRLIHITKRQFEE